MTINREHLAPCPFCGGQADPLQFTRKRWSVDCSSCGAAMISSSTKRDAIESWSTRAQAQAAPDDSSPNAVWLTQAHTICADAGIPSGNIVDRLELLSQWVTDRLHDGAQAAPEAEPVAINQWQYGDAWIDASEADVANARRLGKITRVLYTAPQHDAELVELLRIAAGSIREICKERDVPLPNSTLRRIDAKLATLRGPAHDE